MAERKSKTKEFCGQFVKVVQLFKTVKEEMLLSANSYTLHIAHPDTLNIRNHFSDSGNDWAYQKQKWSEFPFIYFQFWNGSACDGCHIAMKLLWIWWLKQKIRRFSSLYPLSVLPKYRHPTMSVGNHFKRRLQFCHFRAFGSHARCDDSTVFPTAKTTFWNWNFVHFHFKTISKSHRRPPAK